MVVLGTAFIFISYYYEVEPGSNRYEDVLKLLNKLGHV